MKQTTLSVGGFDRYNKTTRRAAFLADMDRVVPWKQLCALIEPVYPKAGNGRPPIGLERMLRIYFLQNWFNLSDPAVEEALYDSLSMREFVGIDLGREGAPDETTVCKFRHLLEEHELGKRLFEEVGRHLQTKGMKVSYLVGTGTICGGIFDRGTGPDQGPRFPPLPILDNHHRHHNGRDDLGGLCGPFFGYRLCGRLFSIAYSADVILGYLVPHTRFDLGRKCQCT